MAEQDRKTRRATEPAKEGDAPAADPKVAEKGVTLHTLLEYIDDAEFEAVYVGSAGVCLPHLTLALAHFPEHPGAAPLVGHTIGQLDRLKQERRGFIDKHDCRARARFTDEEAASWTAALEFLAGRPELFGHEMPRRVGRRHSRSEPASPPAAPREEPETAERLREPLEAFAVEKGQLERRLADFTRQSGAAGCRRAADRDRAPHGTSGGADDLAGRRVARHLGIPAEA
jgi:hypothetical protein